MGYNVAYWNLFERQLSKVNDRYLVNGHVDLMFYHFSSYKPENPDALCSRTGNFPYEEQTVVRVLTDDYRHQLIENGYERYRKIECIYAKKASEHKLSGHGYARMKRGIKEVTKYCLRHMPERMRGIANRIATFVTEGCTQP